MNKDFLKEVAAGKKRKERDYWLEKLQGELIKSYFPYDHKKISTGKKGIPLLTLPLTLAGELFSMLMKLCKSNDYMLYMALTAALVALLNKYTGNNDIIVGTPIYKQEIEGEFVNTVLVLRHRLGDNMTFKDLLKQVRQVMVEADENQNFPLETLVYQLNIQTKTKLADGESPLFDVAVLLRNIHDKKYIQHVHPNMIFSFLRTDERIAGAVEYNSLLYKKTTIERIITHLTALLREAVCDVNRLLADIEILSAEEKRRLLVDFNQTAAAYEGHKTITRLFEEQVARTPDSTALVSEEGAREPAPLSVSVSNVTYKELNRRSGQLARILREKGIRPDTMAAVMEEPSLDMIVDIMGIIKAGGAYLPLDPQWPKNRVLYMLRDCRPLVLLTGSDTVKRNYCHPGPEIIMTDIVGQGQTKTCLTDIVSLNRPEDLAYTIYTSGSTGKPKGVLIEHHSVVNLISGLNERIYSQYNRPLRVALVAPYYFDGSVKQVFAALLHGHCLHTVPADVRMDGYRLFEFFKKYRLDISDGTPTHIALLLDSLKKNASALRLKHLIIGGEALLASLVETFFAEFKGNVPKMTNVYGPSECCVDATSFEVTRENMTALAEIPIGKPMPNYNVYILDQGYKLTPIGAAGELCITGAGVARGYLNNPELTFERFINHKLQTTTYKQIPYPVLQITNKEEISLPPLLHLPYSYHLPYLPYSPIYRTGDLARWLEDGNIQFLGRIDQQVKIRGFRIELTEISNQLLKHAQIKEAVVIDKEAAGGNKYLCAYVVPYSSHSPGFSQLKEYLSKELPSYMIPSYFVLLDALPLTLNGKIDRTALPEPEVSAGSVYTAPRDGKEKKLQEIFTDVLFGSSRSSTHASRAPSPPGIDDNFFELGGHSLSATILISNIHKEFNVRIPLKEIFKQPDIRGISGYLKTASRENYICIAPVEEKAYYALSSAQKRLYILQQMNTGSIGYNTPAAVKLTGPVNRERLLEIFRKLVQRHESFRTSFEMVEHEPVQKIHEEVEFEIAYYELTTEGTEDAEDGNHENETQKTHDTQKRIISLPAIADFIYPFDLSQAPLLRVGLMESPGDRHILMLDMHHIISDGISMGIFVKEFMDLYNDVQLPPLKIRYRDYSEMQNSSRAGLGEAKQLEKQKEYWHKRLEGEIPVLNLPIDFPRPLVRSFEGAAVQFEIGEKETTALKEFALKEGVTLYMVLFSVFNVLLARIGNQEEVIVGTPVAGRRYADLQQVIGMFVNTLVMKNHPAGAKSFKRFLHQVKDNTLEAFENQDYQFEDLVEHIAPRRDTGRNPLFDTSFLLQNMEIRELEIPGLKLTRCEIETRIAKFDISLTGEEEGDKINLILEYCREIFEKRTIERLSGYFKQIIFSVLKNPQCQISAVTIIPEEEKRYLLYDFNDTETAYPNDKTIHRLFAEQVERTPEKIALVGNLCWQMLAGKEKRIEEPGQLTYKELNNKSDRLAQLLLTKGVNPGTNPIVAIMVSRSPEMIIGLLGILKAGGAYLPIDSQYPEERIRYMMADSSARILVSDVSEMSEVSKVSEKIELILIDKEIKNFSSHLDHQSSPLQLSQNIHLTRRPHHAFPLTRSATHLNVAYILYTSGSTGKPKGVMIEHRSLVNYVQWGIEKYINGENAGFPLYTTISFDLTVSSIYLPLLSGNRIYIYKEDNHLFPVRKVIEEDRVDIIKITPSHLMGLSTESLRKNTRLKTCIVGGEKLGLELARNIYKGFAGQVEIYNEYGPSEATVGCMIYKFDDRDTKRSDVPIGTAINNVKIYILSSNLHPVPVGITAEIYIGGVALARGYLNRPGLTGEKFIDNPFVTGERIYKTGDLARHLPEGDIEFVGRVDDQVKIRGYRIESGEIENLLLTHQDIKEAKVLAMEKSTGGLCAYIVPRSSPGSGSPITLKFSEIKEYLAGKLPGFMIPSYFVQVDHIPLTFNGKVDRKKLPPVEVTAKKRYTEPASHNEKIIAQTWMEVLGLKQVGIHDNFFDLGGNSLDFIKISNKLKEAFNKDIQVVSLFRHPTISYLAKYLSNEEDEAVISNEKIDRSENRMQKNLKRMRVVRNG